MNSNGVFSLAEVAWCLALDLSTRLRSPCSGLSAGSSMLQTPSYFAMASSASSLRALDSTHLKYQFRWHALSTLKAIGKRHIDIRELTFCNNQPLTQSTQQSEWVPWAQVPYTQAANAEKKNVITARKGQGTKRRLVFK